MARALQPRTARATTLAGRCRVPAASRSAAAVAAGVAGGGVDSVGLVVGGRGGGAEAAVAAEGAAAGGAGAFAVGSTVNRLVSHVIVFTD